MIPRTFYQFILACIAFIAVTCSAVSCNSADMPITGNEGAITEWREVMTFSPVALSPPSWCGKDALVVKELEFHPETNSQTGSIVHIDLRSNKTTRIVPDAMTTPPCGCSYDGSKVFYVKLHNEPQDTSDGTFAINDDDDDNGSLAPQTDGLWTYDLKTGKTRKIAQIAIDYMPEPASPAGEIFAMVPRQKNHLKLWKIDLPGWQLVPFPATDDERNLGGQWSTTGKYLLIFGESLKSGKQFVFYDPNGKITRILSDKGLQWKNTFKTLDDGLYFFRKDGQFMRFDPWADKLEEIPFKIEIRPKKYFWFDISSKKEIAYIRHDSNSELWIYSLVTKQHLRLGSKEPVTSFSPDGKYLGIVTQNISGKDSIAIMQRFER